jgi:hypothetical protein
MSNNYKVIFKNGSTQLIFANEDDDDILYIDDGLAYTQTIFNDKVRSFIFSVSELLAIMPIEPILEAEAIEV